MIAKNFLFAGAAVLAVGAFAVQHHDAWQPEEKSVEPMTFTAEKVAVDNVTKAAVATGNVVAVSAPYTLRGDYLVRDDEGRTVFSNPTCVTTCSNEVGHTHWNLTGEFVYKSADHVIARHAWLRFYEVPIFYFPYLWYPLNTECGFEWMPGYTGRWGAFLLTKYSYDILGDPRHQDNTWWLKGNTQFDLREKNGIALGEDLKWNLGDYGAGFFRVYYAWDQDAEDRYGRRDDKYNNWGSTVPEERYSWTFAHRWRVTERDTLSARGCYMSDSYYTQDFYRKSFFEIKEQWQAYSNSGVFWEHLEDPFMFGVETSGRLNHFYSMTERLPEVYFDLNPQPLFSSRVNYETQNRAGFLSRSYAKYASGPASIFGAQPGIWCDYETFRFDTYHRLTAPFRTANDMLSVVPRVGFHGTYWDQTGNLVLSGAEKTRDQGNMTRAIGEVGVTLAARGTGWVDETTSHTVEPYLDILLQEATYSGDDKNRRPYIFDNIDGSLAWEDQFAGRGRNLPYSYYGLTPGVRNSWGVLEESGYLREILDFDAYAAVMFDKAEFDGLENYGEYDSHKLAKLGDRNYGSDAVNVMPGARLKWKPERDIGLMARAEYDTDNNELALASVTWMQALSKEFRYDVGYGLRNHRYWDFSSMPYNEGQVQADELNYVKYHYVRVGCEYQPVDFLSFGPFVRWDIRQSELDTVGGWVDYLTDCLGFRFLVEYENSYVRIDGYEHKEDWSFGFYVYLRAFGNQGNFFGSR